MVIARYRGTIAAVLLILLGIAMAVTARGFPTIGLMTYGPGFFPTIIAVGLMLSGIGMLVEELRGASPTQDEVGPFRLGSLLRTFALIAIIAFFGLALDPLGFHVVTAITIGLSVLLYGGRWPTVLLLSPLAAILLHLLFYNMLRVPLPWGLLQPFAW